MIRLATTHDAGEIADIYRPLVTDTAVSFELEPPDAAEMARRIERVLDYAPWLVYERDGAVTGYAYATRFRERAAYQWSVEVTVYVRDGSRGAGVGRALYASLFAALTLQGFRTAFAGMTLPNDASEALHRAVGFTPIGVYRNVGYKHGRWHDVAWMARDLAPHVTDPPPPVPLRALRDSAELTAALLAGSSSGAPRAPNPVTRQPRVPREQ
jgi:L-amino acid N-acyltransferase YncA